MFSISNVIDCDDVVSHHKMSDIFRVLSNEMVDDITRNTKSNISTNTSVQECDNKSLTEDLRNCNQLNRTRLAGLFSRTSLMTEIDNLAAQRSYAIKIDQWDSNDNISTVAHNKSENAFQRNFKNSFYSSCYRQSSVDSISCQLMSDNKVSPCPSKSIYNDCIDLGQLPSCVSDSNNLLSIELMEDSNKVNDAIDSLDETIRFSILDDDASMDETESVINRNNDKQSNFHYLILPEEDGKYTNDDDMTNTSHMCSLNISSATANRASDVDYTKSSFADKVLTEAITSGNDQAILGRHVSTRLKSHINTDMSYDNGKIAYDAPYSVTSDESKEREVQLNSEMSLLPCVKHLQCKAIYFCQKCRQAICQECFHFRHSDCFSHIIPLTKARFSVPVHLLNAECNIRKKISQLQHVQFHLRPLVARVTNKKDDFLNDAHKQLSETLELLKTEVRKNIEQRYRIKVDQLSELNKSLDRTMVILVVAAMIVESIRKQDQGYALLNSFNEQLEQLISQVHLSAQRNLMFAALFVQQANTKSHCQKDIINDLYSTIECISEGGITSCNGDVHVECLPLRKNKISSKKDSQEQVELLNSCKDINYKNKKTRSGKKLVANICGKKFLSGENYTKGNDDTCKEDSSCNECNLDEIASMIRSHVSTTETRDKDDDVQTLIYGLTKYMQSDPSPSFTSGKKTHFLAENHLTETNVEKLLNELCNNENNNVIFNDNPRPKDVFSSSRKDAHAFQIVKRYSMECEGDTKKPFVSDVITTQTDVVVILDAANHTLKTLGLSTNHGPSSVCAVTAPLSMCLAGWHRIMVSCSGKTLCLFSLRGTKLTPIKTQRTNHQYQGLAQTTPTLVAAACPSTHSVDLLDCSGKLLRTIIPVQFDTGPHVIGSMPSGHILVVNQSKNLLTEIFCIDHVGHVMWRHKVPGSDRRNRVSKLVGGDDGKVYYALLADSTIYRFCPETEDCECVLQSSDGVKFPSCMMLSATGQVTVTLNELPSVHFDDSIHLLPHTVELDVFDEIR